MGDNSELKNYKALQFDCYGTLIDWEGGALATEPVRALLAQPGAPGRDEFLATLNALEARIQTEAPDTAYPDVLAQGFAATAKEFGLQATEADAQAFGASVPSWPAFPDSAAALKRLHDMGLKLVVLSNVHNAGFAETRKKLEDGWAFDAVYTAQDIGSYKPSLNNFEYAVKHIRDSFGIDKDEILITANSKKHDHAPGHEMGMKGAWIARSGAVMGVTKQDHVVPDWEFPTMAAFADAMEAAKK